MTNLGRSRILHLFVFGARLSSSLSSEIVLLFRSFAPVGSSVQLQGEFCPSLDFGGRRRIFGGLGVGGGVGEVIWSWNFSCWRKFKMSQEAEHNCLSMARTCDFNLNNSGLLASEGSRSSISKPF